MARFGVSVGENVGALDCLVRVSEDVVDDEDGGGGVGGAGSVCGGGVLVGWWMVLRWKWGRKVGRTAFGAIEVDVFALGTVAF